MWMLIAYSTEQRGEVAVRHRIYTTSEVKADAWRQIPRVDFSDSGHGIVFIAERCSGRSKPEKRNMTDYVSKHWPGLIQQERHRA